MKAYRKVRMHKTKIVGNERVEGERIEDKVERAMVNGEPIEDGAPEIYTERKEGVVSAYNIRTDRWEIACEGMDTVQKSLTAQRDNKPGKVVQLNENKDVQNNEQKIGD